MVAIREFHNSVAMAVFVAAFLLEGLQRCSGVLFSATLELADESRQIAAIPLAVSRATTYITSVISKRLVRQLKQETLLLWGTFTCAVGAGLCFLSSDVIWLSGYWGIIFGAGVGVAFPESMKLSQKFRSQNFLSVLYSGAPSFACIMAPYLMDFFLSNYGLNGTLLLLSGVALNAVPFILAAFYRISFHSLITKWRIRKKNKRHKTEDVVPTRNLPEAINTSNGICNEGFQLDDTIAESENSRTTSVISGNERNGNLESIQEASYQIDTENHNFGIIPNVKPTYNISEENQDRPNKLDAEGKIINTNQKCANSRLFEKSFTEEDVLSEEKSNNSGGKLVCSGERRRRKARSKSSSFVERSDVEGSEFQNETNTDSSPPVIESTSQNFMVTKSQAPPSNIKLNFPLEIKVHVVECTFTANEIRDGTNFIMPTPNARKHVYRRHSNSLMTSSYEHIDFNSPNFLKSYGKPSQISGYPTSKMYLITEDDEFSPDHSSSFSGSNVVPSGEPTREQKEPFNCVLHLKKLFKPSCLVIIYTFAIYEITLVTLLTVFADLANDASHGGLRTTSGVLAAFGVGGIAGRLSLRYWGDRLLLEGAHATAAVLFILNGVVIAGILWSPNLYWVGGFYGTLGFLEIGISTSLWNLVKDNINEDARSALFSTSTLVCGLGSLCVPYILGLSRDDLSEYDGLLQITSCLSVLCAVLCYVLPRLSQQPPPRHFGQSQTV